LPRRLEGVGVATPHLTAIKIMLQINFVRKRCIFCKMAKRRVDL